MDNRLFIDSSTKDNTNQLKVAFMYKPRHDQNVTLQYQVIKSTSTDFNEDTLTSIRKKLFKENTHVFSLLMLYKKERQ